MTRLLLTILAGLLLAPLVVCFLADPGPAFRSCVADGGGHVACVVEAVVNPHLHPAPGLTDPVTWGEGVTP